MHRTQIFVLEEDVLFRETLVRLLESEEDLAVMGECANLAEATGLLGRMAPDLILIGIHREFDCACEFAATARQAGCAGRILFLAEAVEVRWLVRALQAGVSGIFPRSRGLKQLLRTIRMAAAAEGWVEPETMQVLAAEMGDAPTDRDAEVLRGVLDGLTNRAIAERLEVAEGSVKATLRRLFRRHGVGNRAQLVRVTMGPR
jgi:DNA-binding NarL/FixJ family response regulator